MHRVEDKKNFFLEQKIESEDEDEGDLFGEKKKLSESEDDEEEEEEKKEQPKTVRVITVE